jgi:hypothetical protein
MRKAQYSEWHQGWLAFVAGWAVTNNRGVPKVFRTEKEAEKAAARSKMNPFSSKSRVWR